MAEIIQIQLKRDTTANWTTNNPVLASGEPAWDTDTCRLKIGDGVTAYNDLKFADANDLDNECKEGIAGENILSFDVVMLKNGELFKFDPTDPDNYNRAVGVAKTSALTGETIRYKTEGVLDILAVQTEGNTLFANNNGTGKITDTYVDISPLPNIYHEIGNGIGGSFIFIRLNQPFQLI